MKKIKYRLKQGYGSHRMNGKRYVAGDVIKTNADELRGALDKFESLEDEPKLPEPSTGLHVEKVEGGFNVVNSENGNVLNDEPLKKKEADAMAKDDTIDMDDGDGA